MTTKSPEKILNAFERLMLVRKPAPKRKSIEKKTMGRGMKKWKSESAVTPRVALHEEPKIKMHAASNWETLLPDCIEPGLDLIFIGINPGRHSAEERHHFAGPVNHFWKCLYGSKLTLGLHCSHDDKRLPKLYNIGVTNMVKRPTTRRFFKLVKVAI